MMTTADAYALALIAQGSDKSNELLLQLTEEARLVGECLINQTNSDNPEIQIDVEKLREWAKTAPERKRKMDEAWRKKRRSGRQRFS